MYSWGDDDNQSIDAVKNFQNAKYDKVRGIPKDFEYKEYTSLEDENTLKNLANRMDYH